MVGAYLEDSKATGINNVQDDNTSFGSGAVYVFSFDSKQWFQELMLKRQIQTMVTILAIQCLYLPMGIVLLSELLNEDSSA